MADRCLLRAGSLLTAMAEAGCCDAYLWFLFAAWSLAPPAAVLAGRRFVVLFAMAWAATKFFYYCALALFYAAARSLAASVDLARAIKLLCFCLLLVFVELVAAVEFCAAAP